MNKLEKEKKVHQVFETIYENYDHMNSIISFKRHIKWRKDIMSRMQVTPGSTALDVCCGTGDWSFSLAEAVGESGTVIGLDFSENMLSIAKKRNEEVNYDNLSFIHGNAMELPFEDNHFDYVTIGFGLRNVPDYMQVLKEMYRVVKPGGKVVCLETSHPTLPIYKQLYYFYFGNIMPLFGKLFAKSYQEYAWLQESAKDFPDKNELKRMFQQAGFINIEIKGYTGGVAAMHMGEKSL
ncbi:demethylmenaquinone methyltransferase/2-methoxy-6-polyprenyl-1,4-benzoquinol methylase [Gracilibacillus halotolerans]|uniref:Demethylmenaquinone methyltransferase n=1 Tax=Gracilibacillus halotolerans TaxID=74386 RepID=A0A841RL07_9BACI|nr:demethylmenaquinone methyltransferase [Gracilibacillus halotolerans]MBB6511654.1 demethylmenaquinone methyltransferase/2-methoxy-6-polyprenyl-1,4-benzoquinol methylase [Gracilibacillus halotolerans]